MDLLFAENKTAMKFKSRLAPKNEIFLVDTVCTESWWKLAFDLSRVSMYKYPTYEMVVIFK